MITCLLFELYLFLSGVLQIINIEFFNSKRVSHKNEESSGLEKTMYDIAGTEHDNKNFQSNDVGGRSC